MTRSTLSDVGLLPKFKLVSIKTGSGGRLLNFVKQSPSGNVGMIANVVVAVGIWLQAHSVH